MLSDKDMTRIENIHNCNFIPSNIPGVLFLISADGWAIITEGGKRSITGDWDALGTLTEELIGLKEVYGKKRVI
jgi:hypothetical protein